MKRSIGVLAAAISLWAASWAAVAHHSANAQWHVDQKLEITGVLKEVKNIMPHAHWFFDIADKDGKVATWDFETVTANQLRRQGVSIKDDIKVGQTYKLVYSPSRTGAVNVGFLVGIYINGKRYDFFAL